MVSSAVFIVALWVLLSSVCNSQPLPLRDTEQSETFPDSVTISTASTATDTTPSTQIGSLRKIPTIETSNSESNTNHNDLSSQMPDDSHPRYAQFYDTDDDEEIKKIMSAESDPTCAPSKAQYVRCFNWIKLPSRPGTVASSIAPRPGDEESYRFWTPGIFIAIALMLVPVTMALVDFADWIAKSWFPRDQPAIRLTKKGALVPSLGASVDEASSEEYDVLIP